MRPQWVTDWLTALRSGKYKKGVKALRSRDNSYCCLGVLCEIQGLVAHISDDGYLYGSDLSVSLVPKELQTKLGLSPLGFCSKGRRTLTSINDMAKTFEPAIKAIEEQYPE